MKRPVLVVHGIWDSAFRLRTLTAGLQLRGVRVAHAVDLVPNDGRATIATLGAIVAREAEALRVRTGADRIHLVGFSMGALVSRWFLQRAGGKEVVERFVSISGPHHGTMTAYALPFAGVRDMRPGSATIRDLESDVDPFGKVEVHCIYTPFDLTVVPARTSILENAASVRAFPVALHRWMVDDGRVLDHVADILIRGL